MPLAATVLLALVIGTTGFLAFRVLNTRTRSGDAWYLTQMAFTNRSVSKPYCWRPLVPFLARHLGFEVVSVGAALATAVVAYFYVGGGWVGFACVSMFLFNPYLFLFSLRCCEYTDGVAHLLMVSSLWALSVGHPVVWPLLVLCGLCRETLVLALLPIIILWEPVLALPLVSSGAVAYFLRREDKDNVHPLVCSTVVGTFAKFIKEKKLACVHYAHTIQPLRGLVYTVPFMWYGVNDFSRLALAAVPAIWFAALPASGQSRIIGYAFWIFIPFAAALPPAWLGLVAIVCCFWPVDFKVYDETGTTKFAFVR